MRDELNLFHPEHNTLKHGKPKNQIGWFEIALYSFLYQLEDNIPIMVSAAIFLYAQVSVEIVAVWFQKNVWHPNMQMILSFLKHLPVYVLKSPIYFVDSIANIKMLPCCSIMHFPGVEQTPPYYPHSELFFQILLHSAGMLFPEEIAELSACTEIAFFAWPVHKSLPQFSQQILGILFEVRNRLFPSLYYIVRYVVL